MAITYPRDLLATFPGWTTKFEPLSRQEQSRTAGGRTIVKNLGSPLWVLNAISTTLDANNLDRWRAILETMENGLQVFLGYSLSRCYPIAYPHGSWPAGGGFNGTNANLHTIGGNNKSIRVSALRPGFSLLEGDFLQIGDRNLHRVVEAATADAASLTPVFEVRPHLWPGTTTGMAVSALRPHCHMNIVPGSISSDADPKTGLGTIGFSAIEAR